MTVIEMHDALEKIFDWGEWDKITTLTIKRVDGTETVFYHIGNAVWSEGNLERMYKLMEEEKDE